MYKYCLSSAVCTTKIARRNRRSVAGLQVTSPAKYLLGLLRRGRDISGAGDACRAPAIPYGARSPRALLSAEWGQEEKFSTLGKKKGKKCISCQSSILCQRPRALHFTVGNAKVSDGGMGTTQPSVQSTHIFIFEFSAD